MDEIPQAQGLNLLPEPKRPWFKQPRWIVVVVAVLVLAGAAVWGYQVWQNNGSHHLWQEIPQGLVADKISQSADILINLPNSIKLTPAQAESSITFDPQLKGRWSAGAKAQELIFKPSAKPDLGKYYRVTLAVADTRLQKDFLVDQDPKVGGIFPHDGSEAPETSNITIVFNRPMVPLTTLDEQLKIPVPVTITPQTKGKFKWITTRTLQFIPDTRLMRSTSYTVTVNSGFVSVDGLSAEGSETHFSTRALRYNSDTIHHDGVTLYDEPVSIAFNQPVDLAKTAQMIEVKNQDTQGNVPVVVEYGTREASLGSGGSTAEYTDKSVLYIYGLKDRFGRPKFWDSKTNYLVTIKGAVPLEGDINLNDERSVVVQVPDILESVTADSPRSNLAAQDLFDPKGHLVLNFYEEVDKNSSQIKAQGLKSIAYGQTCQLDADGNEIRIGDNSDCEKQDNKKQLVLGFNEDAFKPGQSFDVELAKIFNVKGLQLNSQSIHQTVNVYPQLQIISTNPGDGQSGASVTDLVICTNSPLQDAQPETFNQMLKSNVSVGRWNWDAAYQVPSPRNNDACDVGQFNNHIHYGLRPQTQYQLQLSLTDHFGQTTSKQLSFTSGDIPSVNHGFSALQKDYNVATPAQTKLTYAAENLDYVDLQVCQISAETMLGYLNPDTAVAQTTSGQNLNCSQTWQKRIDLPPKYWDLNYFVFDLKDLVPNPLGYYVLSFSNPQLREQAYNPTTRQTEPGAQIYERTLLNVTNLAAQEKKVEVADAPQDDSRATERRLLNDSQGNLYWVTQIGSMDPVSGATVQIYQKGNKKYSLLDSAQTDSTGVARAKPFTGDGAAVVSLGNDSTIVSSATDKFQWQSSYQGGDKTYIYSDRPIYRPGQEVDIKGLYRIGYDDVYDVYTQKPVSLQILDSKNTNVSTQNLRLSKQGTFAASFNLPADAALGTYTVQALGGYYTFDVEDYVPAAFKLDLSSDKDEYIAGDNFTVNVDANYYFGVPVESGSVQYTVTAQDYYFDRYQDATFSFGSGWYYSPYPSFGDSFILRGKVPLGSDGKAQITQKLDFNKFFNEDNRKSSKIFVVQTTVTNGTGQAVSGQQSFIVHRGEFYLGVNLQKNYFGKNDPNKILVKSVDTQGKPTSVSGISGVVNKVSWNYFKRQEVDGSYYYTSEQKLTKVLDFKASTDGNGDYSQDFTIKDEGEYQLTITATDSRGNPVTATQEFYVYGQGTVEVQPLNNESLDLAVENPNVEVGQNVNIVIKSPFPKAKALVAVERGRILDYQIIDVDQSFYNYTLNVKEDYIPNFYVTVLLLSPSPEVRFGQAQFNVNTKQKTITVETKPDKNNYLPGEKVTLDVTTKDDSGKAVSADVSLSVADLSVLALVGNPKKDPVSFFYGGMPLTVTTSSNIKNILVQAQIPTGTKGGGGAEPGDLATKKRGVFKDTAYWNADVITDSSGHAQVSFTLPDNLTTWQVESLGLTEDTKLGVGYGEFQTKKQLMVTPLVPRFVIPGDEFVVGGKVFNQTGSAQSLKISFQSSTLEILGDKQSTLNIGAGQTQNVYLKVRAPVNLESGQHTINITAESGQFKDSVDSSFPITPNDTFEAVATSNYTTDSTASEYVWLPNNIVPNKGSLQIKSSATLAGVVPDALNYLVAYPYGCTEQMMSKLQALAAAKRFMAIKNIGDKFILPSVTLDGQSYSADDVVKIGLARIMANQTQEGGFAYYPQMKPDFYLTMDVINALEALKAAGYTIDDSAVKRAADFVYSSYNSTTNYFNNNDTIILTAYTLNSVPQAGQYVSAIMPRVLALSGNQKYFNEDISNLSLTYLAVLMANTKASSPFEEKVFQTLENRVTIDGRGAYLSNGLNQSFWWYYETPVKDTALLIKAESLAKRDFAETPNLLRWLQNSRGPDGSWQSTNNTVTVLDALVDYLNFKGENNSSFSLDLLLDGKSQGDYTFTGPTVANTFATSIPLSSFTTDKLSQLQFVKKSLNNAQNGYYYDMLLKYYLPVDAIAPRDEGFSIERELYALDDKAGKNPVHSAKVGDVLRGRLTITTSQPRNLVAIESFIPAGMELVNFNLATSDQTLLQQGGQPTDQQTPSYGYSAAQPAAAQQAIVLAKPGFWSRIWLWTKGLFVHRSSSVPSTAAVGDLPDEVYSGRITETNTLYPDSSEYHDDRIMLFSQEISPGVYTYDYYVRALIPGKFQHLPATASELYTPENFGRSRGEYFTISQ